MFRAKYDTTAPEGFAPGEPRNPRKSYKGKKRHPSGKSGKGVVREKKSRHAKRA